MKHFSKKSIPKFSSEHEKEFIISTSLISIVIIGLCVWKGMEEGFTLTTYILMFFNLAYTFVAFILKKSAVPYFCLAYSLVLTFIIAFSKTFLYNNYTGLLCIFLAILFVEKLKRIGVLLYFIAISVSFALNEENLCHYFLHTAGFIWIFLMFDFILSEKKLRKKLILYDDEIKILNELSKNRLQKSIELEGFSESTIYRRIKSACKRNHLSKKQLIEQFKLEQKETK